MDKTLEGIAWFGNMYQKFEAVCLEVDDIVNQEAIRYVENQVQTVGSNVKQFCTEFMQEVLLSPQKDAEKQVNVSLMQKTDISANQVCCSELDGDQTAKEVCSPSLHPGTDVCSGTAVHQSSDHGKCGKLEVRVAENPVDGHIQLVAECKSTMETMVDHGSSSYLTSKRASDSVELTQCHEIDVLKSDSTPDSSIESAEKSETDDAELNSRTIVINQEALPSPHVCGNLVVGVTDNPIVEEHIEREVKSPNVQEGKGSSNCLATKESCNFVDRARCVEVKLPENVCTPDKFCVESDDEYENIDLAGSNKKKYAIKMEPLEVNDVAKLEGSCVLVDGSERHSLTNERKGCRSYKKKLEEAFFSRRMLAGGGQELHDSTGRGSNQQKGNTSKPSILDGKSDTSDLEFGDSDWELV